VDLLSLILFSILFLLFFSLSFLLFSFLFFHRTYFEGTAIDRAAGRQGEAFPGLIPAIYGYLEALGCNSLMIGRLRPYLTLLQKKASGELPTTAQWIRSFVRSHPEYKGMTHI
jgi:Glutamate-cysteine ligase